MRILSSYFAREIFSAVAFVLAGFLALFSFFDFISELEDIGRGQYELAQALAFVLLSLPNHIYELMPIAALIGTIYALAQFASSSEFTAMRAAGLGRLKAMRALLRVGLVLAAVTAMVGEIVAPPAEKLAQDVRLGAMGGQVTGQFRSGIWIKDTLRDDQDKVALRRFVNISQMSPGGALQRVRIFEFDPDLKLQRIIWAPTGDFVGADRWQLNDTAALSIRGAAGQGGEQAIRVRRESIGQMSWASQLTPDILAVMALSPDRMSAWNLREYVMHLTANQQDASRYEIAMWKKVVYPLAVLVMMALALPFAYLHARAGSIGYKVFAGIMLGVAFHFLNGLFSHLGLLNTWPPWLAVSIPSVAALLIALFMLYRVGSAR
ncbi:MAG: LPS export ABC transporter permease LptG [Burkholderiaceae bacterium]